MIKRLLLGVAVATLGFIALVVAQTTPLYNWNGGSTTLVLTLPSGSSVTTPINTLRNTASVSPVGAGGTVTNAATTNSAYLVATGAITTWAVTLANPANNGQIFCVSNGTSSTLSSNITVTAIAGTQTQTLNTTYNSQSLTAGASACWAYFLGTTGSTGTWYRVQ